jgi:hypothetical protein
MSFNNFKLNCFFLWKPSTSIEARMTALEESHRRETYNLKCELASVSEELARLRELSSGSGGGEASSAGGLPPGAERSVVSNTRPAERTLTALLLPHEQVNPFVRPLAYLDLFERAALETVSRLPRRCGRRYCGVISSSRRRPKKDDS